MNILSEYLFFAKDGEVYNLDGLQMIAIGGAYSVDKHYRLSCGLHWFPDEQPSDEIKNRVETKLASLDCKSGCGAVSYMSLQIYSEGSFFARYRSVHSG